MRTIEQKRKAAQDKIDLARERVDSAIVNSLPAYIVRSRRNALAVACSDLAMLEGFIMLEGNNDAI